MAVIQMARTSVSDTDAPMSDNVESNYTSPPGLFPLCP